MIRQSLDCMVDARKNLRVYQPQNLTVNTIFEYNDIRVLRMLTISVPYSWFSVIKNR